MPVILHTDPRRGYDLVDDRVDERWVHRDAPVTHNLIEEEIVDVVADPVLGVAIVLPTDCAMARYDVGGDDGDVVSIKARLL
jgi:hypothetical protein